VATYCCIGFTSADAYFRDYSVIVPENCVDAEKEEYHVDGLKNIVRLLGASMSLTQTEDFLKKGEVFRRV
jgi:isochorismate hydrolase